MTGSETWPASVPKWDGCPGQLGQLGCNSRLAVPLMYASVTENWVNWHRIEGLKGGLACTTSVPYIHFLHKQEKRPFALADDRHNTVPQR